MNILFDYQAFEFQKIGGVSRLFAEIIPRLKTMGINASVGLKESDNAYIGQLELNVKPLYTAHKKYFGGKKYIKGQRHLTRIAARVLGYGDDLRNINQEYCIHLLKGQHYDIFEPTFFSTYFLPYLKGKPFAMEVHDMIPELFQQYFPRDDFQIVNKKLLCPLASAIHTPSMKTKEDLVNILNIPPEKITVIGRGVPSIPIPETTPPRPIDAPYLLFVGERGGYKNFHLLLQELEIIVQSFPELNLLCTGRPFEDDEQRMLADLKLTDNVRHIYANDDNFYSIYHYSLAFIYPSTYEGFGLPILEAFICGCPVMLNNASCFPEVGGDAAIYFDINRRGDLAEHIEAFLQAPEQDRADMIARGRERAKLFSWEESARKLLHAYYTLA